MSSRELRLAESGRLSQLLIDAAAMVSDDFAELVEPYRLPPHLARAILTLGSPAPMRELASHMACDPSYVTALADKLEFRALSLEPRARIDARSSWCSPTRGSACATRSPIESLATHWSSDASRSASDKNSPHFWSTCSSPRKATAPRLRAT